MPSVPVSLATLPAHSIFVPGDKKQDDWELVDTPTDSLVGTKTSRMVMRDKDLIVANGSELRMCSLAKESWSVDNGSVGWYQTLRSECLNFTIHSLALNPTGKLLAVVGNKQTAVIALPSLPSGKDTTGDLDCRGFAIDEFEYSASSQSTVSKVAWHPLGEAGESLWILTSDGRLQEYDVRSPDDPTQTFTFLPQASASSSKFTAVDPLSRHATSFAFSPLSASACDFGPLVVHVLIANGDLYAMGPIMPLRSEVPRRYLQSLKAYVQERRRRLDGKKADQGEQDRLDSWDAWVDNLISQSQADRQEGQNRQSASTDNSDLSVRLHPPHLTPTGGPASGFHQSLARQGPVIYSPGPTESPDELEEDVASDFTVLVMPRHQDDTYHDDTPSATTTSFAVAWSSGRVDVGLMARGPEPAWTESEASRVIAPTMPIVETISLSEPKDDQPGSAEIGPTFSQDTVYPDTIYVQSAEGLSMINVRPAIDGAIHGNTDGAQSEVSKLIETDGSPAESIVGSASFCNISFGYGAIALTAQGQLAFTELDFRVTDHLSTSLTAVKTSDPSATAPAADNRSLLSKPLDFAALTNTVTSPADYDPHRLVRSRPDARKPLTEINASQLKLLGDITSQIRRRTEAIRAASQTIENRLDLQVKEYQRQLKVLKSARGQMKQVTSGGDANLRVERIAKQQKSLAERLDKVVSRAMASHTGPDLGDAERKWLKELEGARSSLEAMTRKVDTIRQQVTQIRSVKQEPDKADSGHPSSNEEPSPDMKKIRSQVDAETDEIRRMMRKMDRLKVRVEAAKIEGEDSD